MNSLNHVKPFRLLLENKKQYTLSPFLSAAPPPGGLPGAPAAPHRGAAGDGEQPADGRALLPAAGWLPAAGVHRLNGPPAAAGDAGVQGGRLEAQQHGQQVLLQRASRVKRQPHAFGLEPRLTAKRHDERTRAFLGLDVLYDIRRRRERW